MLSKHEADRKSLLIDQACVVLDDPRQYSQQDGHKDPANRFKRQRNRVKQNVRPPQRGKSDPAIRGQPRPSPRSSTCGGALVSDENRIETL